MPWPSRLVASLSPWRHRLDPEFVHVGFVVDRVALRQVFFLEYFGSPLSVSLYCCPITWKWKITDHLHHRVAQ
jgi:hypothetical protein